MKVEAAGLDKEDGAVHVPSGHALWAESWYFDFVAEDASSGGFVRFGVYPALGVAWWWAYLVTATGDAAGPSGCQVERPVPPEVGLPFHLHDPGIAIEIGSSEPGRRWRVAVESAATPDRPAFGLDLDWTADGAVYRYQRGSRCEQPGWASATLTVGGHRRVVDGPAQRDHSWGIRDWWRFPWDWCAGWLAGGQRFQATRLESRGRVPPDGYRAEPGGAPSAVARVDIVRSPGGGTPLTVRLDDLELLLVDVATVPVDVVGADGRRSLLERSMVAVRCRDGRRGVGWREHNQPVPPRP